MEAHLVRARTKMSSPRIARQGWRRWRGIIEEVLLQGPSQAESVTCTHLDRFPRGSREVLPLLGGMEKSFHGSKTTVLLFSNVDLTVSNRQEVAAC